MSELLNCPFCGGEAELIEYGFVDYITLYVVACTNDDCNMTVDTGSYANPREAIETWNTRAERTCKVDDIVPDNWEYKVWSFELSCGHDYESTQREPPNYCPNCGAKVIQ